MGGRKPAPRRPRLPDVAVLEKSLGHVFADRGLLETALTHRSYAHEKGGETPHSESLEFLGDAVLSLGVSQALYARFGHAQVGDLARARAFLVSEVNLARKSRALGLGEHLRLGRGEERGGGREKDSLLADAYESILGAIYLDAGLPAAVALIDRSFTQQIARMKPGARTQQDHKTDLQEALQAAGLPVPTYQVSKESGPDHRKSFSVDLLIRDQVVARGVGPSKKSAEQKAARQALRRVATLIEGLRGPQTSQAG